MINRANWKLVKAFLKYRREVDQISKSSMRLEETWLRHLLEWADSKPFNQAPKIRPTLPEYILTTRQDGSEEQLSHIYISKVIRAGYRLFDWLHKHKSGFNTITQGWLDTLKPPRMTIEPAKHEAVTLEEIRAMAQAQVYTLRDRRIRAAAVFLFLSGMRIGAFVSLPVLAVDFENLTVYQFPKLGVRTKNKKHATTYLLNIPDLLEVVQDWDHEVRKKNPDGLWFAHLATETEEFLSGSQEAGEHRDTRARKDLKDWLNKVDLPYHSPHKFRHGHAVYALKNARDIPDLKAVSQNLMHSNISITDGVYGILSDSDVGEKIINLGKKTKQGEITQEELLMWLEVISSDIAELKRSPK